MFAGGAAQIKCRVVWPSQFTAAARDFIDRLLCVDPSRRLGCLKNGPADVKNHPWFVGLDWRTRGEEAAGAPRAQDQEPFDDSNFGPPRCLRTLGHATATAATATAATATAATATAATATVRLHVDHYEDDGVKNYPQSDFPKQRTSSLPRRGSAVVVRRPRPAGLARLGRGAGE